MSSILVTGGAGFLGSHLCEALLQEGNEVLCLDNFFTGRKSNIAHLISDPKFELLRHDVTIPIKLEVDRIYNLACPASPPRYQYDPVQTLQANVQGSINMLDNAKRTGARILQASTSEVYGDSQVFPTPETYFGNVNPNGPRACYDEGKRAAETLFFDYHRQYGVDIRIPRIHNTFGPRMDPMDGRVVSTFIRQALLGEDLTIQGDGSHTRSFCYVDDMIQALLTMMEGSEIGPINVGSDKEISVNSIAELVLKLTSSSSEIRYIDNAIDDPNRRYPDVSLAREVLGWEAKTPLDVGLMKTIKHFEGLVNTWVRA